MQFVAGAPSEIRVHNTYTLRNSGTAKLDFFDVRFPDQKIYGRTNLQIELNGRKVSPENLPLEYQSSSPGAVRLRFDSEWAKNEKRDLAVDYTFAAPTKNNESVTVAPEEFHLGARGWLPVLLPPNHILASAPTRPEKMIYSVRVPDTFAVLARGSSLGRKQDGAETTYRFELGKRDLAPFVVAGHYIRSSESNKSANAIFWTAQPLEEKSSAVVNRLNAAWDVLEKNFGVLEKRTRSPYVVQSSALVSGAADTNGPVFAAFPGGVLINSDALGLGIDGNSFATNANRELARTWFGDALYPAPAATIALGEGLPLYATIVIDEASGGGVERQRRISELLNAYDEEGKHLNELEKSVTATTLADPGATRRLAGTKAAFLYVALEDQYGEAPVRSGLAQAVQILWGKEVTVNDVRAAIEYTTGKNLAEQFRVWLYEPGIPENFRLRYGRPVENEK